MFPAFALGLEGGVSLRFAMHGVGRDGWSFITIVVALVNSWYGDRSFAVLLNVIKLGVANSD